MSGATTSREGIEQSKRRDPGHGDPGAQPDRNAQSEQPAQGRPHEQIACAGKPERGRQRQGQPPRESAKNEPQKWPIDSPTSVRGRR